MTNDGKHRDQFDRFAQDAYLRLLLKTDSDAIIPTLFLDLMNRVNMVEGQVSLLLAELERADDSEANLNHLHDISLKTLGGAVDMANILKALMEYYELQHQHPPDDDDDDIR
jgi:hypothetical protein